MKERENRASRARSRSKDKAKEGKIGTPRTRRCGSRERETRGKDTPKEDNKVSQEGNNEMNVSSGIMNKATNMVMTLMGITDTQATMTVAVKKEKANEDAKCSGKIKGADWKKMKETMEK